MVTFYMQQTIQLVEQQRYNCVLTLESPESQEMEGNRYTMGTVDGCGARFTAYIEF